MQFLLVPVLGLTPGLFWLWLIYKVNKYRPEPKRLVIHTFLLGMAAAVPIAFVETALILPYIFTHINNLSDFTVASLSHLSLGEMAYLAFVVAGFTEELFKFLVVRTAIYSSPYFDEPIDGLVYSSAAALGLASLENVFYSFFADWQSMLIRTPITSLGHVMFSAMWGYPLALQKFKKKNANMLVVLGLLGAMAAHGFYDFFALEQGDTMTNIPSLIALIFLYVGLITIFVILLKRAQKTSPFKDKNAELLIACPNCQTRIPYHSAFCPSCGTKLAENKAIYPEFCGKCGSELSSATNYCPFCGSRVIKKLGSANEHHR
jgi:RsiW-degrading membrane proteinase PrsW (M82 family)/RNA polymerase subunit RPABC4/transcription elongation factor Spt4